MAAARTPHALGIMADETANGGPALFVRSGLQKKVIRKLKRGEYRFTADLDLHGYTTFDAQEMLEAFVDDAQDAGDSAVLIIHGKGLRSGEAGGVLKRFTHDWLKHHADVKAFCSALPKHGGTGAVYVLLRSSRGG